MCFERRENYSLGRGGIFKRREIVVEGGTSCVFIQGENWGGGERLRGPTRKPYTLR